jgi:hypothetical protein
MILACSTEKVLLSKKLTYCLRIVAYSVQACSDAQRVNSTCDKSCSKGSNRVCGGNSQSGQSQDHPVSLRNRMSMISKNTSPITTHRHGQRSLWGFVLPLEVDHRHAGRALVLWNRLLSSARWDSVSLQMGKENTFSVSRRQVYGKASRRLALRDGQCK